VIAVINRGSRARHRPETGRSPWWGTFVGPGAAEPGSRSGAWTPRWRTCPAAASGAPGRDLREEPQW